MGNINDYKIVAIKSEKYFQFLKSEYGFNDSSLDDKMKERLGFYLFAIESLLGITDTAEKVELITDTEFNKIVHNNIFDDYGIDAVYINDNDNTINLFNFKYRISFKPGNKQGLNDSVLSTKFLNALYSDNISELNEPIKTIAKEILEKLVQSREIWNIKLFVVSNEDVQLDTSDVVLKSLQDQYGLEIIPVGLTFLSKMMSIRPDPISAQLILDKDAIMSFSESSISSSKSYIVRLPASELIRISSDNESLRNNYSIEDLSPLATCEISYSVLFDNVRGLVLKSKYNPNILKTLKEEPTKFFLFNNGITITADDIEAESVNADRFVKLDIKNFQVLNGGQTLRTIHNFNKQDTEFINSHLAKSEVLVRVFKTASNSNLNNKIAEYTNSQNSISLSDLKSLSTEQIQIEQYLDEHNIVYSRKSGDTGLNSNRSYEYKIGMEKFGQILLAYKGDPQKSTNQKKKIFDKYYDFIFSDGNLDITESPVRIKEYFKIKQEYNSSAHKSTEQKIFFIIYLKSKLEEESYFKLITILENALNLYIPESGTTSEARKLLQLKFKEFLDSEYINPSCEE